MKILYHHRTKGRGVEGVHIREMVMAFKKLGHEVIVVSPPGVDPFLTDAVKPDKEKYVISRIWKWVSDYMPQIAFEILELFYNMAALLKINKILRHNKIDFIYERYAFFCWIGVYLARKHNVPLILEVNEVSGIKRLRGQLLIGLAKRIEKFVFRNAGAVVTITKFLKKRIEETGIDASKVHVISNAVNLDIFDQGLSGKEIRDRYNLNGKVVLGFAGLFTWWDDLTFLIENFASILQSHADLHLLLIGDPADQKEKILNLIKAKSIEDHVTLTGRIERIYMPQYVAAMDICIIPHSNPFGSPVVLFEYMAMGKPVIAPRLEPIEEIISDGKDGILFNAHDGAALKHSILNLAANEQKRIAIGREARNTVMTKHRWEDNAKGVLDIVDSIKDRDIPILMYHDIRPDDFDMRLLDPKFAPYVTRLSDFDAQMAHLINSGYSSITFDQLLNYLRDGSHLPERPVIITFDDGQASNYRYAFPILRKYELTATFFVIAGRIGKNEMLSWSELREMYKHGMSVGSHTLTHPIPTTISDGELRYEFAESRRIIEDNLGHKIKFFSSPTGYLNKATAMIAKEAGYEAVCIGTLGINKADMDLYALKRIAIKRNYTLETFQSLITAETSSFFYYRYTQMARAALRRLIGAKLYEALRSRILKSTVLSKA